jgi:hypothetical protein
MSGQSSARVVDPPPASRPGGTAVTAGAGGHPAHAPRNGLSGRQGAPESADGAQGGRDAHSASQGPYSDSSGGLFRVLVTGSRDWADHDLVRDALAMARYQQDGMVVVHGACPSGADAIASWWVRRFRFLNIREERWPADWARLGRAAGPLRNRAMVEAGADLCLAFIRGGSRGASHCAALAEAAGIPVRRWTAGGPS